VFASGGKIAYAWEISGHSQGRRWLKEPTHAFAPRLPRQKQLDVDASHRSAENSSTAIPACGEFLARMQERLQLGLTAFDAL
jgi:hypothetical protein